MGWRFKTNKQTTRESVVTSSLWSPSSPTPARRSSSPTDLSQCRSPLFPDRSQRRPDAPFPRPISLNAGRPSSTTNLNSPPHTSLSKRPRRPLPPPLEADAKPATEWRSGPSASTLFVASLPPGCAVLELKSGLEMYGPISHTRVDAAASSANVTFRSAASADAALAAALDPTCGIAVLSHPVEVYRASDHVPQWRIVVGISSSSKLLRAELPLDRLGRSNKKLNADTTSTISGQELPYKGRAIVAYDLF